VRVAGTELGTISVRRIILNLPEDTVFVLMPRARPMLVPFRAEAELELENHEDAAGRTNGIFAVRQGVE
jgi:hypothetical protein